MFAAIGNFFGGIFSVGIGFFYDLTGSYGFALILFTIALEIILLPLNLYQTKQTKKMNDMQPLQKELEKKFKKDPQRYNQELAKLYRDHNVKPLMTCLPLFIQLPILYSLFYALRNMQFNEGFLFIADLGQTPQGVEAYILAILAAGSTYISTKTMPTYQNKQTQGMGSTMLFIMPIMMGVFSFSISAGVSLYWIVRNLFTIVKQTVLNLQSKKEEATNQQEQAYEAMAQKEAKAEKKARHARERAAAAGEEVIDVDRDVVIEADSDDGDGE